MSAIYIAIGHLSKLVVGFILLKLIAYYNGAEGLNQLGNLLTLVSVIVAFSGGGITNGVIKYSAQWRGDNDNVSDLVSTSIIYSFVFGLIVIIILGINFNYVDKYIFNGISESFYYYVIFSIIILFYGVYNTYQGLAYGSDCVKSFPIIQITSSFITITYFLLFFERGLLSSYNAIAFMLASVALPFLYLFYNESSFTKKLVYRKPKLYILKLLYPYTLMAFVGAVSFPFVEVVTRYLITDNLGAEMSGLWTAAIKLSLAISAFFTLFLVYRLVPQMVVSDSPRAMFKLVVKYLGYIGIPYFFILTIAYMFREYYISYTLSADFATLSNYLGYQFIGDFFKILSYVMTIVTIAKSWPKIYIFGEIIQGFGFLLFTCFSLFFSPRLESVFLSYQYFYILYFIISILFFLFYVLKRVDNNG
ncbi:TPA: hypothetical protein I6209_002806 [Vibrio cholerae]|nr:hypothetical protein [Vibrio cholerae]